MIVLAKFLVMEGQTRGRRRDEIERDEMTRTTAVEGDMNIAIGIVNNIDTTRRGQRMKRWTGRVRDKVMVGEREGMIEEIDGGMKAGWVVDPKNQAREELNSKEEAV